MSQPWLYRFLMCLCEKTGHLWIDHCWQYNGYYHKSCKICGRIISEKHKERNT